MALRGISRRLNGRFGVWGERLAAGGDGTSPVYPPLHLKPTAAPSATAAKGDVYFDSTANVPTVHDGTQYRKLADRFILDYQFGASSVDDNIFIADRAYRVLSIAEVHAVAGNDAGAVTLQLRKCTGTQAPSAGAALTTATFNLKSTANTVVTATLTATTADLALAAGDRLAADFTGTLTALAGGVVTIVLEAA
jgi:hypothetical protein